MWLALFLGLLYIVSKPNPSRKCGPHTREHVCPEGDDQSTSLCDILCTSSKLDQIENLLYIYTHTLNV